VKIPIIGMGGIRGVSEIIGSAQVAK